MIVIEKLTKTFGPFTAVDNMSFTVKPGEVLGFLGPNGAGKSTTMKMICGFLTPTEGRVTVHGFDTQRQAIEAKKLIGYLPEGAPSYGDMTVESFLNFIAEVRGFRGAEKSARVGNVLNKLQLNNVLHQSIETLSKGFKRRVGLAQAIIHDPKVLILDEPTDGLDPNQKHEVRNLIKNLSSDKIVIISTHILEEVHAVCTRAVIIANGKLLADGTPAELEAKSRYNHAVTVRLESDLNIESQLKALTGVAAVERNPQEHEFIVFPEPGKSLLHDVQHLANRENWPLQALFVEKGRLDDVFRTVTTGGGR